MSARLDYPSFPSLSAQSTLLSRKKPDGIETAASNEHEANASTEHDKDRHADSTERETRR